MKHLFFLLFTLPLFASAQQTTAENRIAKIELVYSVHTASGSLQNVGIQLTNLTHQPLTVVFNDGNGALETVEIAANTSELVSLSPWLSGQSNAAFYKKNGNPYKDSQLFIDVPLNFY